MLQVVSNSKYEVDIVADETPGDGGRWPTITGKDNSGIFLEAVMTMEQVLFVSLSRGHRNLRV